MKRNKKTRRGFGVREMNVKKRSSHSHIRKTKQTPLKVSVARDREGS